MDAQTDAHALRRNGKQRLFRPRQGTAGEGNAEGDGAGVGLERDPLDLVEIEPGFGRRADNLEHHQITRHTTTQLGLVGRAAGHVVGHRQDAHIDAFGLQTLGRQTEIHHVTGVFAEAKQDAAAAMREAGHVRDAVRRRRRKNVTGNSRIGHAGADKTGECRVVPGTATNDQRHLALRRGRRAQHAAGHRAHMARINRTETRDCGGCKYFRIVIDARHFQFLLG